MKSLIIFMRRWGLILVGILLIIGGLIYGSIPQKTPYQNITKAFMAHYLSGRGIGYMQLEKIPTLYIVNEGQFLPAFSAGQPPQVFSTSEYFQNPNGYYQHYWMTGIALSLLGLIFIGLGLFMTVIRGKKKKDLNSVNAHVTILASAEKQPEQLDQYQEPETIPGN